MQMTSSSIIYESLFHIFIQSAVDKALTATNARAKFSSSTSLSLSLASIFFQLFTAIYFQTVTARHRQSWKFSVYNILCL